MRKDTITTLNLATTSFLVLLGMSLIAPILPFYAETFNVNYTLIGLAVSAFGIGRILFLSTKKCPFSLCVTFLDPQNNSHLIPLV